ncbi:MAG: exosortase/archaeosortase family protein [Opitutales bacterium]
MNEPTSASASEAVRPRSAPWLPWANLGLLAVLWADLFRTLHVEWSVNEQYSFGFLVPFLGLYLLYLRWESRPAVLESRLNGAGFTVVLLMLVLLFPVRLLFMANPDWRLAMWAHAILVYGMTLLLLARWGGRAWLLHFFWPFTFFLVAVPWPTRLENPLIQGLMGIVAAVTVDVLNLLGIHAIRQGNLIQMANTLVGVEEACSGVRSFQSTLMAALFIGELLRFRLLPRIGLLGAGALMSLVLNLGRTFTLTLLAHDAGSEVMTRWHDPIGYAVTFGSFFLLLGLAWRIRKQCVEADADQPAPPPEQTRRRIRPALIRPTGLALCALLLAGGLGGAEAYFALRAPKDQPRVIGTLDFAAAGIDPTYHEIDPRTRALLRYSEGFEASWPGELADWRLFYFFWDEGKISSFAGVHRPEVCLQAAGIQMEYRDRNLAWSRDGLDLEIATYLFQAPGNRELYVFFAVWDDRGGEPVSVDQEAVDRIGQVFRAQRIGSRRSLQIILTDLQVPSMAAARDRVRAFLDRTMTVETALP